jgi:hypothetical protein
MMMMMMMMMTMMMVVCGRSFGGWAIPTVKMGGEPEGTDRGPGRPEGAVACRRLCCCSLISCTSCTGLVGG